MGSSELAQLADLLRLGASTARRIAKLRQTHAARILQLVERAEMIAADLDEIAGEALDETGPNARPS